jgi:hypothetical protein
MKRKELTEIFACFVLLLFAAVAYTVLIPDTGQTIYYNVAGNRRNV